MIIETLIEPNLQFIWS